MADTTAPPRRFTTRLVPFFVTLFWPVATLIAGSHTIPTMKDNVDAGFAYLFAVPIVLFSLILSVTALFAGTRVVATTQTVVLLLTTWFLAHALTVGVTDTLVKVWWALPFALALAPLVVWVVPPNGKAPKTRDSG